MRPPLWPMPTYQRDTGTSARTSSTSKRRHVHKHSTSMHSTSTRRAHKRPATKAEAASHRSGQPPKRPAATEAASHRSGRSHVYTEASCRAYLWLGHPSLRGGGGHRTYTTLADFNVGLVSGARWQRKRCICTGRLAIRGTDDLDTRRTPFLLFAALHRAAVEGREGPDSTATAV